jgi:hypothetical protein
MTTCSKAKPDAPPQKAIQTDAMIEEGEAQEQDAQQIGPRQVFPSHALVPDLC